ncbi:heavy-metal-associated domain-containing protein [Singulisphaera rosea]
MTRLLPILAILLTARASVAEDVTVKYRLRGLFQPERVDDLRRRASTLTFNDGNGPVTVTLVDVNYETAEITFAYDPGSSPFKGKSPQAILTVIDNPLRNATRHNFTLVPLGPHKADQLKQERIAVAGLDCKGCAYGAYRAVATIEGVERAVVSFKEGYLLASIDPQKTNRTALITALKKAEVDVIEPDSGTK